jgi:O-antigen/teichoic acid export membrane protein
MTAAAGSLVLALSSKLLMLLASVLLARWMGAEEYGVYATAMALVLLLTVPAGLGFPTFMIRKLASYRVHQQWGLMRGLLIRGNLAVLVASLLTAGIAAAVIWWLAVRFGPDKAAAFGLALILIPLTALGAMRSAALRGLQHVILGQLPESLIMPALFLGLVGSWWLTNGDASTLSPQMVIAARVIAAAAAFFVGAWLLLRRLPPQLRAVEPRYDVPNWIRAAGPLLFIGGMGIINTQMDILMLATIQGAESAGVYQAAARGAELVAFSLVVVNMAIQPTISCLYASGDMVSLQRVITAAARGALMLALPAAGVLAVFSKPLLGTVFGADFERGAHSLAILCATQVVNAGAGSVGVILNMTGHERDSAVGMAVGATTNLVLNAALIPLWDIEGAALATGLSLVAWNVVLMRLVWKRTGLSSTVMVSVWKRSP